MAHRMKVVLADSNKASARQLADQLRERGTDAVIASDAVMALSLARDLRPDAIVVTAQLAGGAAHALKRLRSNVYTTDIPVVGIASEDAQGKRMLDDGARELVIAPVDVARLDDAIRRHEREDLDFTRAPAQVIQAPERLADVAQTRLLDTPPEASFDRLTRLASRLLGTPVALVSLVDRDRQFFKSQVGLGEPWASERQIGLSHSFCQWVVSGNEPLIVSDANEHPVLSHNPAIRDLGVIAYAGVPLLGRTGQPIGSFCTVDSKPRAWKEEDVDTLEDLARITRAYAVLHHAKQGGLETPPDALEICATVAGHAIMGAGNILRREGERLDPATRTDLHTIIAEQAAHLTRAI